MNKTMTIAVIALVAVVMGMSTIMPVMAVSASGVIVSINPSEKHGVIERNDGSGTLYQFNILRDTTGTVQVGDIVVFTVDPENSRHATNVGVCNPPDCGGASK